MTPQLVQWMVRIHPDFWLYPGGMEPAFTTTTAGWEWEAAYHAGLVLAAQGISMRIVRQLTVEPDLTVFGSEITAATVLGEPGAREHLRHIGIRCVCGPADGIDIWDQLAPHMPRIQGLSTIGVHEAELLLLWARRHGYQGTAIDVTPLSAEDFATDPTAPRSGFAYLGTVNKEKRVPLVAAAAKLADVPLLLALVYSNAKNSEDFEAVKEAAGPRTTFLQVGVESKKRLLAVTRGAVTFSHADSQWLPGTEARACGGIALAGDWQGIRSSNGDSMLYVADGNVEDMASVMRILNSDNEVYAREQRRQAQLYRLLHRSTPEVTARLVNWMQGILAA